VGEGAYDDNRCSIARHKFQTTKKSGGAGEEAEGKSRSKGKSVPPRARPVIQNPTPSGFKQGRRNMKKGETRGIDEAARRLRLNTSENPRRNKQAHRAEGWEPVDLRLARRRRHRKG